MATTTCQLCKRERAPSSTFCEYHLMAKGHLESAYKEWDEAYGGMSWKEYLKRVSQSAETGQWVKEVAELLLLPPKEVEAGGKESSDEAE